VIHDLAWPRSMTWTGLDGARFIRPIRWIVAVVNGKPLKFSFAGVTAGDTTLGHRFLGKGPVKVKDFADYEKKLRANGVIVRPAERREKISKELAAHAKRAGYRIHEDAELLKLVTYLNECPSVLEGDFDPAFLALPDEILITVMRGHQKYFAGAIGGRSIFLGVGSEMSARRLSAKARTRHVRIPAGELSRQGRTHSRDCPLAH